MCDQIFIFFIDWNEVIEGFLIGVMVYDDVWICLINKQFDCVGIIVQEMLCEMYCMYRDCVQFCVLILFQEIEIEVIDIVVGYVVEFV